MQPPKYLANLSHMDFLSDLVGINAVYMSAGGDLGTGVSGWVLLL